MEQKTGYRPKYGIPLVKAQNNRAQGWLNLKEWLKPGTDETGTTSANLLVFRNCSNLIRSIPALQFDSNNSDDVATEPHEYTHGPDAIRYFVAGRPSPAYVPPMSNDETATYNSQVNNFLSFGG